MLERPADTEDAPLYRFLQRWEQNKRRGVVRGTPQNVAGIRECDFCGDTLTLPQHSRLSSLVKRSSMSSSTVSSSAFCVQPCASLHKKTRLCT